MPESAHKVLHELTAAGLLSADHATDFGAELETGADALLTRLVAEGHITQFQADKFLHGQATDIYFGDYVVIDQLGQGGMGTVMLAKHRRMDRQVAIKVLSVTALDSKDAVARFYQEVKVAAQLTHPNIVHAYDAGEHHGFHYLVMEYVPGHDLSRVLSELGPIPPMLTIDYMTQAAAGLEYAHRKGVVHRDLKPSNLLLDNEGVIKILDMGLARIGGMLDSEESAHLTTTGQMMGTVEYMSPEQAEDTRVADARSDIYSLGCTLFRLVTGRGPFTRDTVVKTILAHRDAPIPSIAMGYPEDAIMDQLFRKMVAKNPKDRFQSTTLLLGALREIVDGGELSETKIADENRFGGSMDTAAVIHVTEMDSPDESIPEAIIPADAFVTSPVLTKASSPGPYETWSSGSEVVYITDTSLFQRIRGLIGKTVHYLAQNPDVRILTFSIVALLTTGWLGLTLGPYTWFSANKYLKKIRYGEFDPNKRTMIRIGKWLSLFATILSFSALIAFIAAIASKLG